ncbi:MAG: sugar nucleotide-binding protein [Ruminococcus sp.]|nr:sugar nucleotide-binding protein [Ruminococcus sp.]
MLVGYTGFVGSNLRLSHEFNYLINSKNIESAYGVNPDRLIYSGVPAEMFIANKYPEQDAEIIENAKNNIKQINPKTVVLISTVAVYDTTNGVNEDYEPDTEKLTPYGKNRLELEKWVEDNYENHLIVRLPAIFGENLKKNFICDYINFIPPMLNEEKYSDFSSRDELIKKHYISLNNGFYKCNATDTATKKALKESFKNIGFSALNFTDSRSVYQFFNLKNLYFMIEDCLDKGIKKINLVTPPVSISELYNELSGQAFENLLNKEPFNYDLKTKHFDSGYIMSKNQELAEIKDFVDSKTI